MSRLRLEWHDHSTELLSLTRDLCGRDELTDVTLVCNGSVQINAHRMLLAGASKYFRDTFKNIDVWKHPVVFLKDVDGEEMQQLLRFIYLGEVNVSPDELERLLKVAKELGIKGLDAVKKTHPMELLTFEPRVLQPLPKRKKRRKIDRTETVLVKEEHDLDIDPSDFHGINDDSMGEFDPIEEQRKPDPEVPKEELPAEVGHPVENELPAEDMIPAEENEDIKPTIVEILPSTDENPPNVQPSVLDNHTFRGDEGDNVIEMLETVRGHHKIALNGFVYVINRRKSQRFYWKCAMKPCHGTVMTDVHCLAGEAKFNHMHPPDYLEIERIKIMNRMKNLANNLEDRPASDILDEVLSTASEEVKRTLPKRSSLLQKIQRKYKQIKEQESQTKGGQSSDEENDEEVNT